MNDVLGTVFGIVVTPWKIVGYCGMLMFTGRWIVQLLATRKLNRPTIPRSFWLMSLAGSMMMLSYFIWGKNDSVGILANLFPAVIAIYNLVIDIRAPRTNS
jgi:lipid-A-disaccharide synthase-like uncharacterized protein